MQVGEVLHVKLSCNCPFNSLRDALLAIAIHSINSNTTSPENAFLNRKIKNKVSNSFLDSWRSNLSTFFKFIIFFD